jgi:hypothetical protein
MRELFWRLSAISPPAQISGTSACGLSCIVY